MGVGVGVGVCSGGGVVSPESLGWSLSAGARLVVGELSAQKKRLASYATQAQFALASIYDGAAAKANP